MGKRVLLEDVIPEGPVQDGLQPGHGTPNGVGLVLSLHDEPFLITPEEIQVDLVHLDFRGKGPHFGNLIAVTFDRLLAEEVLAALHLTRGVTDEVVRHGCIGKDLGKLLGTELPVLLVGIDDDLIGPGHMRHQAPVIFLVLGESPLYLSLIFIPFIRGDQQLQGDIPFLALPVDISEIEATFACGIIGFCP